MKKDDVMHLKENYIFTGEKDKNSRAPLNYSRQSSSNRGSNNNSQLVNSINASNQRFIDKEKGLDQLLNNNNKALPKRISSYSMRDSDDNDSEKMKSKKNSSKKQQLIELTSTKKQQANLENQDKDVVMNPFNKKKTLKSNYEENEDLKKQDSFKVDNRRLMKKEKICDSDTEDEGSDNEKDVRFVILPDNFLKKKWDLLIAMILIYTAIVLPFRVSFVDQDSDFMIGLDIAFDCLFGIDLLLNFFSAYIDNEDNIVKGRQKIAVNYLKTWFPIDFFSIFPITKILDNGAKSSSKANYTSLLRITKLPKLYRLVKLTKLFRMVKVVKKGNVNKITKYFLEKLKVNANIERLIYFILGFLILNHLSACIWYLMAKLQDMDPDCWVTRLGYIDASPSEIYIISFYWTLTTVTTVGYGDINAGTTLERMYNLFIMSFGVLMYSFAIGSLSSIVSTLDAKTAEMNQKLQILSSIKSEFKLDQDIYDKVRKVIKYDLSRNQKDKMNFLQELPNKLRIELSKIMHDKLIEKLYFFREQPSDFIAYVAPLLKPVKFTQNDYLYKISDMIDEMYFVAKGTISFSLSKEYLEKEIKEVKKNNNFGEIEMCLNEKLTYNIKVKSRNCELFVLKKNDFLRLSVNFKEFIEKFLQKSLMLYLRFNDERKRLMREMEESKLIIGSGNDSARKGQNEKNDLDKISEEEEDGVGNGSEEFDIYNHQNSQSDNNSRKISKKNSKSVSINSSKNSTLKDHQAHNKVINLQPFDTAYNKKSSLLDDHKIISNKGFNKQPTTKLKNQAKSKYSDSDDEPSEKHSKQSEPGEANQTVKQERANKLKEQNSIVSKASDKESVKNATIDSDKMSNMMKNFVANSDMEELSANDINHMNQELSEHFEKKKNKINKTFNEKIDKIIAFLEEHNMEFSNSNQDNNPLELLKKLKHVQDINQRNEMIDKIEKIVGEVFNKDKN